MKKPNKIWYFYIPFKSSTTGSIHINFAPYISYRQQSIPIWSGNIILNMSNFFTPQLEISWFGFRLGYHYNNTYYTNWLKEKHKKNDK